MGGIGGALDAVAARAGGMRAPDCGVGARRPGCPATLRIAAIPATLLVLAGCAGAPSRHMTAGSGNDSRTGAGAQALPAALRSIAADIGNLRSLSAQAVTALLGQPDFQRHEPPAELWQYRSPDCVLDLFLYPVSGEYRVEYVDSRLRDAPGNPPKACLDKLIYSRTAAAGL
jgi:hypothetical protein